MDLKNSILVRVLISVIDILVLLFIKKFELFLSMLIWYSSLLGVVYYLIDNGYRISL